MSEIQLTESFNDPLGRFQNYDAYDAAQRDAVRGLSHTDIRVFDNTNTTTAQTVSGLSTLTVTQLNALTMTTINNAQTIQLGEGWTAGTVGKDATRNNFRRLALTLAVGTNTTSSVTAGSPVDISGYATTDFLTIALPAFPNASVTQATSWVDLTSHSTGDFTDATRLASVNLGQSITALTAGNSEFRVTLATLLATAGVNFDRSKITGVRFRIQATGVATFTALAMRVVAATWQAGAVDTDTRYGQLRKTPPLNGDVAAAPAFTQPNLFRAHVPASIENDPKPIDGEVAIIFNTGSKTAANQFTIYMRELAEDFMQMLDIDANPMSDFNGRVMPDTGEAAYNTRVAGAGTEFDSLTQGQMDLETQFALERRPDLVKALWVYFNVQWTTSGGTVMVGVTDNDPYTFALPNLTANTLYAAIASLEDTSVRLVIYPLNSSGGLDVDNKTFDTSLIEDDSVFKRRKGRFGWSAALGDGDAYIESISDRGMTYGEYRSLPYESFTPVVGVELYASITPARQLIESLAPGPYNGTGTIVSRDRARSTTGESWRVQTFGDRPMQGFQSHYFNISDFNNARLTFDIFYPAAVADSIDLFLMARNGRVVPLLMPTIKRDQWQTVNINFTRTETLLGGEYALVMIQPVSASSNWWIDNLKLFERSVTWDARSTPEDPWGVAPTTWTPFYENLNKTSAGVLFDQRGTRLQVRAKARRQESRIERVQFKPKYAELGRLLWSADKLPTAQYAPVASWTSVGAGGGTKTVNFTSTATDSDGFVVAHEWSFGDGQTAVGQQVSHKYAVVGLYTVTHTVMDNNGNRAFSVATVSAP